MKRKNGIGQMNEKFLRNVHGIFKQWRNEWMKGWLFFSEILLYCKKGYKAKSLSWNRAFPWRVGGGEFCLRFSIRCAFCPMRLATVSTQGLCLVQNLNLTQKPRYTPNRYWTTLALAWFSIVFCIPSCLCLQDLLVGRRNSDHLELPPLEKQWLISPPAR